MDRDVRATGDESAEDHEAEIDRRSETGAIGGAIAGTSLVGPLGGMEGAVAGGEAGAALDDEREPATEDRG